MHPAPVSGSPVPVRKAISLPRHPGSGDARSADAPSARCPDATPPSSHSLRAKHETQGSQQPEGSSISVREGTGGGGGTVGNAAAGVADQNVEGDKDRRASSKDPTTTEVSVASAVGGEESDVTRVRGAGVVVPDAPPHPADDVPLPACAAGADGSSVELRVHTLLETAEGALARLYDTHDNFFSSDKGEKEVSQSSRRQRYRSFFLREVVASSRSSSSTGAYV